MEQILTALYPIAKSVASPLALSSTTLLLFFILAYRLVDALRTPIERITGFHAYKLLVRLLSFGFWLAMIALLGGLLAYGMTYLVDNYYRKSKLVSDAYRAIGNQEGGSAVNIGSELISGWPDDSVGYSIRGTGWFLNKQYVKAATDFGAARERIAADPRCNREWRNASASLVAALAASNDFASALPISDEIMHCAPEKGMVFNHAKLLIFSDRRKEAISLLQSPQLNDESRPDVRGTVSFELGIAHLLNGAIEESVCHFAKAAEFNQGFEFMVTALATRTVDPQGDLVQDFSLEVATIRDHLSSQFIEAWNSRNEDHRSCRSD